MPKPKHHSRVARRRSRFAPMSWRACPLLALAVWAAVSPEVGQVKLPRFLLAGAQLISDTCGSFVRDVTGDHRNDLVLGDFFGGDVQVFPGRRSGRLGAVRRSAHDPGWFACLDAVADLDGDGRFDAVGEQGWIDDTDGNGPHEV